MPPPKKVTSGAGEPSASSSPSRDRGAWMSDRAAIALQPAKVAGVVVGRFLVLLAGRAARAHARRGRRILDGQMSNLLDRAPDIPYGI